jgi:hypothetical protein
VKYRQAIIMSYLETMNAALEKLASDNDEVDFIKTQVKISKVFKRYLYSPIVAEMHAKKIEEYSIRDVDNYLKSLKEEK